MAREIEFHPGVADLPAYARRLLLKAHARALRVVVTGAAELLTRLDSLLWVADPGDFVAHARLRAGATPAPLLLARTPIWLADELGTLAGDVLLNLGPQMPQPLPPDGGFARLVELVGSDEASTAAGRQRWRAWLAAGHTPVDVRKRASAAD